jgi:hypothetical protein
MLCQCLRHRSEQTGEQSAAAAGGQSVVVCAPTGVINLFLMALAGVFIHMFEQTEEGCAAAAGGQERSGLRCN